MFRLGGAVYRPCVSRLFPTGTYSREIKRITMIVSHSLTRSRPPTHTQACSLSDRLVHLCNHSVQKEQDQGVGLHHNAHAGSGGGVGAATAGIGCNKGSDSGGGSQALPSGSQGNMWTADQLRGHLRERFQVIFVVVSFQALLALSTAWALLSARLMLFGGANDLNNREGETRPTVVCAPPAGTVNTRYSIKPCVSCQHGFVQLSSHLFSQHRCFFCTWR